MDVSISREPKYSKLDNLFILLTQDDKAPRELAAVKNLQKLIDGSGFTGRSDESLTIVGEAPRKITLIGLGKADALTMRGLRTAIYAVGKTARKQRDISIAVMLPYIVPTLDDAQTTRLAAEQLAASDYKFDHYITVRKDGEKPPAI